MKEQNEQRMTDIEDIDSPGMGIRVRTTAPVCYGRNMTFPRPTSSYAHRHELPAIVTEGESCRLLSEVRERSRIARGTVHRGEGKAQTRVAPFLVVPRFPRWNFPAVTWRATRNKVPGEIRSVQRNSNPLAQSANQPFSLIAPSFSILRGARSCKPPCMPHARLKRKKKKERFMFYSLCSSLSPRSNKTAAIPAAMDNCRA